MIQIENVEVFGWEAAIRGMRNPLNSWEKSDSKKEKYYNAELDREDEIFYIGENDKKLMLNLVKAGTDHSKFMRMINVTFDIAVPLYWYKEFDTYRVGVVRDSCSTMHKMHSKPFTLEDFSCEHLSNSNIALLSKIVDTLNMEREHFNETKGKEYWWQMIQLLPSSYNQRSTIQLNYAVLRSMYQARKNHKLDEWRAFCNWVETLPFSELITTDFSKIEKK